VPPIAIAFAIYRLRVCLPASLHTDKSAARWFRRQVQRCNRRSFPGIPSAAVEASIIFKPRALVKARIGSHVVVPLPVEQRSRPPTTRHVARLTVQTM